MYHKLETEAFRARADTAISLRDDCGSQKLHEVSPLGSNWLQRSPPLFHAVAGVAIRSTVRHCSSPDDAISTSQQGSTTQVRLVAKRTRGKQAISDDPDRSCTPSRTNRTLVSQASLSRTNVA